MKRENFVLFVLPFVILALGLFVGFYFGVYRTSLAVTACEIEKSLIPASPVITHSMYNPKTKELILDVENPGGMPIDLIDKSLMLQVVWKQPVVLMAQIPLGLEIPPYGKITLKLELWPQGSGFNVGDILVTTLTYKLPVSNDIYSVVHVFQHSGKYKDGLVTNKREENYEVQKRYEEEIKNKQSNKVEKKKEIKNE